MRNAMDKDGDGRVEKDEFKVAYKLVYDGPIKEFEDNFEVVWKNCDKDGDGNLTVDELAAFYGFDENGTGEMTDDQILQALAMAAELEAMQMEKQSGRDPSPKQKPPERTNRKARDRTIKTINIDRKEMMGDKTIPGEKARGAQLCEKQIKDMILLMELLSSATVTDLKPDKEDKESIFRLLEQEGKESVLSRVEDQNGEMPLHKLARFIVPDDKAEVFKLVYHKIIKKMRDEARDADRPIKDDINKQDSKGKTPMFQAIEMKNILMIELLNDLNRDRPDSLIVTAAGWSVLHQAVNADDFNVVKEVVRGLQKDGGRLRVLINLKDKSGRQPLHIAAFRSTEDDGATINFLMENGASGVAKDNGGLAPPKLAEKAGRRNSKELIEENVRRYSKEGRNSKESMGGGRRPSKEMMDAAGLPSAKED